MEVDIHYDVCECQDINQHTDSTRYVVGDTFEACDKVTHFNELKERYVDLTQEFYNELYNYYTNLRWSNIPEGEDFPDIPLPMSEYLKFKFIEDSICYEMKRKEEQKE